MKETTFNPNRDKIGRFDIKINSAATVDIKQYADDNPADGFHGAALLQLSTRIVREYSSRLNLSKHDTEDIIQETVMSALHTRKRQGKPITGGYVRTIAKALVSRRMDTHKRHEDSKAFAMLKAEIEFIESVEGRHLTKAEIDEIADRIREDWHDPRHKPSKGFQNAPQVLSSDAMGAAFAALQPAAANAAPEGSKAAHDLVDAFEENEIDGETLRLKAWNSLIEDTGAPAVYENVNSASVAQSARTTIGKRAEKIAARWEDGAATEEETKALFAPFGRLTRDQQSAVARTISERPKFGQVLWESALDFSTQKTVKAS